MNKKLFTLLSGVAIITSASLQSCADEFDPQVVTAQDQRLQEYYNNFVKEFGEPDPNHTWGWGGMTPEIADALIPNKALTRALGDDYDQGGRINVNRNQWTNSNDQTSLLNVYGVPGWPNWDGKYYTADGTYTNGHYTIYEAASKPAQGCNIPNDVTEFEILWVSNAIHYKRYTETLQLHVSDFYIQEISTDADYENDADYKSGTKMKYGKKTDGTGGYDNYKMDKLDAKSLIGGAWTHINNFNASMNEQPHLHLGSNKDRNIIYVQSAGTESFQYHPSNSTDSKTFSKFILVELTWDEPLDPEWCTKIPSGVTLEQVLANPKYYFDTKQRSGYYLCFDYQDEKTEEYGKYEGDNVYDNWILKLTPGYPIPKNRWPKRLMCEDLGNTYDFDFNDAVFDLSFAQNVADQSGRTYDMLVVIQAAGGTMPIQVAIDPADTGWESMEIHKLLGNNATTNPVNVIKGGKKAAPAQYRVKNVFVTDPTKVLMKNIGTAEEPLYVPENSQNATLLAQMAAAAFKMKIYILNGSTKYSVSGYELYQGMRRTDGTGYNEGNKGSNMVPQLFNCSADAKWTYENGHIKDAYTHFIDWVRDEQCDYRLRWDKTGYYKRGATDSDLPTIEEHDQDKIDSWLGSWDFGPKDATQWGTAWINKSKCYGGNGAE